MKFINLRSALPTAVLALAFFATGPAEPGLAHGTAGQQIRAKLTYCKTCHGLRGQGFLGYYPIPRLAGQHRQYIENQLRAFIQKRRRNPVMFNVAHGLKPWMIPAVAASFRHLNPPPYGGAPRTYWALGRRIFLEGLPQSNVPACFACHGLHAEGHGEIPRLAGQLYWYIIRQLSGWTKERGLGAPDLSRIMVPTTHNLNHKEIVALAAYLSTLR